MARRAGLLLALFLVGGCASNRGLYSWGPYEDSVYSMCRGFAEWGMLEQTQLLNKHVDGLRAKDRAPAPGVHAHLGYLEYLAGNSDAAVRNFEAEKALYPESTQFIDGMLRRMKDS